MYQNNDKIKALRKNTNIKYILCIFDKMWPWNRQNITSYM